MITQTFVLNLAFKFNMRGFSMFTSFILSLLSEIYIVLPQLPQTSLVSATSQLLREGRF